jgi:hypothetical protein
MNWQQEDNESEAANHDKPLIILKHQCLFGD